MDFYVGDLVEIVSDDGEWNGDLEIGMRGIVVCPEGWHNDRGECVGVDWSISGKELNYCHDIGGILEEDTGYWLERAQLRVVDEVAEFQIDNDLLDDFLEV